MKISQPAFSQKKKKLHFTTTTATTTTKCELTSPANGSTPMDVYFNWKT